MRRLLPALRSLGVGGSIALLAFLLLAGCARRETPAEEGVRTKTLLLGNGAEPKDLDPQVITAFTDSNLAFALFEGLTCMDEKTSQPVPGVAQRWETSADGLTWVFHLRANAKWSNGDPVTAADFVYSIHRMLSPKLASEYSYMLWPIRNAEAFNTGKVTDFSAVGVQAVDDHTLQLILGSPCPWLLALAAHQSWLPVHQAVIEKFGPMDQQGTRWTRPGNLVGNGAFLLKEWTPNSRIIVERNPAYWDDAHCQLQRIIFFPNDNIATDEKNFRTGQLHLTYELPIEKIAVYRAEAPEKLRIDPFLETFFLRFNVTKPPFDNKKLRQALARALNREAIAKDVLRGSRVPAHSLVPPQTAGYTSQAAVPDDFDAARRLLAEAGYPGGKGLPPFEVQIKSDDIHRAVLEAIQQMWKRELGVSIVIAPLEQKTWIQNWTTLSYQAGSTRWIGDYVDPNTFLDMWVTNGGNNNTGWSNAAYDRLIAESGRTLDTPRRQALQQQAEAILLDEVPIVPVFYGTRIYLIHPAVRGWVPSLLGTRRYQYVELKSN
ncbi:MAG: peptide ABC transporter substrate-binding protein [Pseudomonadota bacterium]